jgi:DNA-directed RNA polymerase specialized sigma24 family protein
VHDVYAEVMERLPLVSRIRNLPAWINSLFTRRLIDAWRHDPVRSSTGETDVAEETLRQIIAGAGLNPLDGFVRASLVEALNDALREIAESTGESIDTLTARKRYALRKLSRALKHWLDE